MANSSNKQGANKDNDNETPSPPHQVYLNGDQVYTCSGCHTHLAKNDDIISKVNYHQVLYNDSNIDSHFITTNSYNNDIVPPLSLSPIYFLFLFCLRLSVMFRVSKADTGGPTC